MAFVLSTPVFVCYKTGKGTLMPPSFTPVTLRVLALLGQVTWTKTVCGGAGCTSVGTNAAYVLQSE